MVSINEDRPVLTLLPIETVGQPTPTLTLSPHTILKSCDPGICLIPLSIGLLQEETGLSLTTIIDTILYPYLWVWTG